MALTCRWRSRPQHQHRTRAPQQLARRSPRRQSRPASAAQSHECLFTLLLYGKVAVRRRPTSKISQELLQSLAPLFVDFAAYDVTEQFPALALEFPELKLLDRSEVSRAGVDRDAGQEPFQLQILDARGLFHDIRAGKIVAALFENIDHRLSNIVASH